MGSEDNGHDEVFRDKRHTSRRVRDSRGFPAPGRRKTDYDPRVTFSKKFLAATVAMVNLVYLVVEAVIGHNVCP